MKPLIIILVIILVVFILTPAIFFLIHFGSHPLSDQPEAWADFGDYFNGILTPVITLVGLVISSTIAYITDKNNLSNINKQEMQERPLLYVTLLDDENNLHIDIVNKGIGPLIVNSFKIQNTITMESRNSIFEWLSDAPGDYDNYTGIQDGLVLSPNERINLFNLTHIQDNFETTKTSVRTLFRDLKIMTEYTDIYMKNKFYYERSLDWFGRNLE